MARIRCRSGERTYEVEAGPAVSVLNALLREGVPIPHRCGGKAICGTCRVRLSGGASEPGGAGPTAAPARVNPPSTAERARLEAAGAGANERLACQLHAAGDLDLELAGD